MTTAVETRHKHILIDHPPTPEARYGHGKPPCEAVARVLGRRLDQQRVFGNAIAANVANHLDIAMDETDAGPGEPFWNQPWFPVTDGLALMTMLATERPQTYLEIGSGNSTNFARRSIDRASPGTRLCSIDPAPRADIDAVCDEIHRAPLEAIDPAFFDRLGVGDVLFFDGSHRSFMNSDTTVFFMEVLPRLAEGVIVGMHDIFWPLDYPPQWTDRWYNEQYLLGAYMLGRGRHFETIYATVFMGHHDQARIDDAFGTDRASRMLYRGGGSLWWRHGG
jgi:hypothetical protein